MTLARILAMSVTTLVAGITLTLLSALPACDPRRNPDDSSDDDSAGDDDTGGGDDDSAGDDDTGGGDDDTGGGDDDTGGGDDDTGGGDDDSAGDDDTGGGDDDTSPPEPCEDDSFEPNDSLAEAAESEDLAAILCPGNEDWWATQVETQYDLMFHVTWDLSVGSLVLELFDATGNPLPAPIGEWDEPGDRSMDIGGPFEGAIRASRTDSGDTALPYTLSVNNQFCCDE